MLSARRATAADVEQLLLLDAVRAWAADRGAAQLVVVTAHLDEPERAALRSSGLTVASEWWAGPL
ncbi:hypothetical protein SAMN04488543_3018 [Friedmanniella luteola]|uniref:N-acetyltransferase domain-containing protein n=1 Tax=Friedmanniella luteola TaxID=546871 RepID=A0A1H1XL97_9ACTN|nr:hypothetical protein [Friedmanniella luteola]SDT09476.1 hypothetical protein SAMN04488543_3018 [Friedmanniella luteola]